MGCKTQVTALILCLESHLPAAVPERARRALVQGPWAYLLPSAGGQHGRLWDRASLLRCDTGTRVPRVPAHGTQPGLPVLQPVE